MSTKLQERLLYLVSPIGLLLVWELLIRAGFGDRRFIPAPSDIAVRFWQLTLNGELAMHTAATLWRVLAGFVIGAVPAIVIGLLMAMFRPVRIFFDPLVAALMPIPKVALMPLLLLAFGFGDASKIALVATAVFFPVVVNTYAGAANIERIYWDVAKNYGASTYVMFTRVVFFGALPLIFAGLRIALAVSFVVLVAAEFVASKTGHRLPDLEFVGAPAGRLHVRRHHRHRHPRPHHRGAVPGDRAQAHPVEGGVTGLLQRIDIHSRHRRACPGDPDQHGTAVASLKSGWPGQARP